MCIKREQSICFYNIIGHHFFVPVVVVILLQFVLNLFYIFLSSTELHLYIEEGNFISRLTTVCYLIFFVTFIWAFFDFRKSRKLLNYAAIGILAFCAFAREQELQHWVTGRDDIAINFKLLFNAQCAPWFRIAIVFIILLLVLAFVYLAWNYATRIINEFFHFGTIAWSFATFVACLLLGQFIDWFSSKLTRHTEIQLGVDLHTKLELIEECTEFFLPLIVAVIFVQYHFLLKIAQQDNSQ